MSGFISSSPHRNMLLSMLAQQTAPGYRSRAQWNERFIFWQRPESVSEQATIERAERMVRQAMAKRLESNQVRLAQQGSYLNRTNVRADADIDLRIEHQIMKVDYGPAVLVPYANAAHGLSSTTYSLIDSMMALRSAVYFDLTAYFGQAAVDSGDKAIKISGLTGSRAEVDVVPSCRYLRIDWVGDRYVSNEGIAILDIRTGSWTINYPVPHHRNGQAKHDATLRRYKKVVRILKRMATELMELRKLPNGVPSFLVESLVYNVDNSLFLYDEDDWFGRVRRVASNLQANLRSPLLSAFLVEANGIKPLFGGGQKWSYESARKFVDSVLAHLGPG